MTDEKNKGKGEKAKKDVHIYTFIAGNNIRYVFLRTFANDNKKNRLLDII